MGPPGTLRTRSGTNHPHAMHVCARCGKPFDGLANPAPTRCPDCRYIGREWLRARKKYDWTEGRDQVLRDRYDGRVDGRAQEIAEALGFPCWAVKKRATLLGLTTPMDRRDWTPEEEAQLLEWAGSRTVHWMAKQLGRSEASIVLKTKRMKISRRWREGNTLRDLELCFGCDHHSIDRWIRRGWLTGRRRGTRRSGPGGRPTEGQAAGPADAWVFTDEDVLRFIQAHPLAFRLDKVEPLWFLDLVLAGALMRRALDAVRGDGPVEDVS